MNAKLDTHFQNLWPTAPVCAEFGFPPFAISPEEAKKRIEEAVLNCECIKARTTLRVMHPDKLKPFQGL